MRHLHAFFNIIVLFRKLREHAVKFIFSKTKEAAELLTSVTNTFVFYLLSFKEKVVCKLCGYIFTLSQSCCTSIMERNVNLVTLFSKEERARIAGTLFKVKLQAVAVQFVALLKRNFFYVIFSENFLRSSSF